MSSCQFHTRTRSSEKPGGKNFTATSKLSFSTLKRQPGWQEIAFATRGRLVHKQAFEQLKVNQGSLERKAARQDCPVPRRKRRLGVWRRLSAQSCLLAPSLAAIGQCKALQSVGLVSRLYYLSRSLSMPGQLCLCLLRDEGEAFDTRSPALRTGSLSLPLFGRVPKLLFHSKFPTCYHGTCQPPDIRGGPC